MGSLSCRTRDDVRVLSCEHYVNFDAQVVDGKVELVPTEPVAPSLASEYSIMMNSLTRKGSSNLNKRINTDAVDLASNIKNRI